MRPRPDIQGAELAAFVARGAAAQAAADGLTAPLGVAVSNRITKTIRLAPDLDRALKREVFAQLEQGTRVSESDIIEQALRKHLESPR